MMDAEEMMYAVGFNLVEGIGAAKVRAIKDAFGSLKQGWRASGRALERCGLDRRALSNLIDLRSRVDLEREMGRLVAAGVRTITWESPDYPPLLKNIPFAPPLLYVRGRLLPADTRAIALVGTRRKTSYGQQIARELAIGLAGCGVTIISGLARGIDTIVHEAVLEYGGRTIAVLGSGLDIIYPPENRGLAARIIDQDQGAVISDYPLGTRPQAKNFPPRNRIVSGMSWGTIVVEGDIKSGAMITAKFAMEHGREVFAVPGSINSPASRGPNWLIQQGAKLVCGLEDILEELRLGSNIDSSPAVQLALPESAEEAALLPHLSHEPQHVDHLVRLSGLPSAIVGSTLAIMELRGVVLQHDSMVYSLR